MRPVRLHLDTSDYAIMYKAAPGTVQAHVRNELKQMAQNGRIEIGLSYHVVFELLQQAPPKFREDRLARARLLTELCGQHAFPYPSDLGQGYTFSSAGLWIPRIDVKDFEVEHLVQGVMNIAMRHPDLDRREQRLLSKRNSFVSWVRRHPSRLHPLPGEQWPLPFGREFVESGDFRRYMLGQMTRSDANRKLLFYLTDPETVYKTWFEHYGMPNPVAERRDMMASKLMLMLNELPAMLAKQEALCADVKKALAATGDNGPDPETRQNLLKLDHDLESFRAELTSPQELSDQVPRWKELVGEKAALVAAQILYAFHGERREIKRSDAIDLLHAMYLPHADLWRGDKAFSNLLIKHKVDFNDRVVPTLLELPQRIETEIVRIGR